MPLRDDIHLLQYICVINLKAFFKSVFSTFPQIPGDVPCQNP